MTELNRDFYKDKASKMFGISYEEITDEQRAEAKKQLMNYMYCRSDNYPFSDMENCKFDPNLIPPVPYNKMDCLITAKLLEPKDSDNSLKNLYNRFIRNNEVN